MYGYYVDMNLMYKTSQLKCMKLSSTAILNIGKINIGGGVNDGVFYNTNMLCGISIKKGLEAWRHGNQSKNR